MYFPNRAGVYQIKNKTNGKIYIGSSVDIRLRWYDHRSELRGNRHRNIHLQRAWNKYGEMSFEFSILEEINNLNILLEREQWYLDSLSPDYNIAKSAFAPQTGRPLSSEHKRKISNIRRNLPHPYRNKHLSESHRENISKGLLGKLRSDKTKQKISEGHKGKTLSAEHKMKLSNSHKGLMAGEKHNQAKLNWNKVNKIRKLYSTGKYTKRCLSKMFLMSESAIGRVINKKTWK